MLDIFYWIRKVINVRSSNFLPPVIIPAVILLEGFLCNNCSCSINHNWFFLNHMCGAVCGIAIICQHDINKRFWPFWVKGNNSYITIPFLVRQKLYDTHSLSSCSFQAFVLYSFLWRLPCITFSILFPELTINISGSIL